MESPRGVRNICLITVDSFDDSAANNLPQSNPSGVYNDSHAAGKKAPA